VRQRLLIRALMSCNLFRGVMLLGLWSVAQAQSPTDDEAAGSASEPPTTEAKAPTFDLPQWRPEDLAGFQRGQPTNLGGGLWPSARYPLQGTRPDLPPITRKPPPPAVDAWALAASAEPGELPPELVTHYLTASSLRVVDPLRLLNPATRERLEAFLQTRAQEARYPMALWVMRPGDFFPETLSDEEMIRSVAPQAEHLVVALFPVGDPAAAQIVLSPALRRKYAPATFVSLRQQAIEKAQASSNPDYQADLFSLEMALGLVSLEKMPGLLASVEDGFEAAAAHRKEREAWYWPLWSGLALALGLVVALILRRRSLRPRAVYEFPEVEIIPRLGAPHSSGAGAFVSWD